MLRARTLVVGLRPALAGIGRDRRRRPRRGCHISRVARAPRFRIGCGRARRNLRFHAASRLRRRPSRVCGRHGCGRRGARETVPYRAGRREQFRHRCRRRRAMSTTLVNPARRRVVITGIGGQDGAYLAAQLLARGENVLGTRRPAAAAPPPWRLRELGIAADPGLELRALDIENAADCRALLGVARPSVLFHFAAQSGVAEAQRDPQASLRANALGTLNLLEALRSESPATRFVLASTAELF